MRTEYAQKWLVEMQSRKEIIRQCAVDTRETEKEAVVRTLHDYHESVDLKKRQQKASELDLRQEWAKASQQKHTKDKEMRGEAIHDINHF